MSKQNQYFPSIVFHPGETLGEKLGEIGMGRILLQPTAESSIPDIVGNYKSAICYICMVTHGSASGSHTKGKTILGKGF